MTPATIHSRDSHNHCLEDKKLWPNPLPTQKPWLGALGLQQCLGADDQVQLQDLLLHLCWKHYGKSDQDHWPEHRALPLLRSFSGCWDLTPALTPLHLLLSPPRLALLPTLHSSLGLCCLSRGPSSWKGLWGVGGEEKRAAVVALKAASKKHLHAPTEQCLQHRYLPSTEDRGK